VGVNAPVNSVCRAIQVLYN